MSDIYIALMEKKHEIVTVSLNLDMAKLLSKQGAAIVQQTPCGFDKAWTVASPTQPSRTTCSAKAIVSSQSCQGNRILITR